MNQTFGQKISITRLLSKSNLTSLSAANISTLVLAHFRTAHEVVRERDDTSDAITITIPIGGHARFIGGAKSEVLAFDDTGVVLPMDKKVKAIVSNYHGFSLMIPRPAIQRGLEALIGKTATVDFDLVLNSHRGDGNLIRSAIEMAARELEQAQSPFGHSAVAARFEEFMINTLLHGQPHNYLEAIMGERRTATPKQVRRAEVYIRAHTEGAVRLSQIAQAAGCSVRALQLAFRAFRDTTPMALLKQARLAQARSELVAAHPGATTVTEVAAKYGFYNMGRFAHDYKTAFRQSPSETLRLTFRPKPMT